VSDHATDTLFVLFNTAEGRKYLIEHCGLGADLIEMFSNFGLSSLCNMLAAIKTAKYYDLGLDDMVMSVATDDADLYASEIRRATARYFRNRLDAVSAARRGAVRWSPRPPTICSSSTNTTASVSSISAISPGSSSRAFRSPSLTCVPISPTGMGYSSWSRRGMR
jgi:hypothetical protein